ncbi:MAG: hypothetical protein LBN43_04965 [Oscillospiraceae bacterium]|jgi:predicted small lipoprotein YifL|nr:hypothetical protein [Oscillospiraceae bacterium]
MKRTIAILILLALTAATLAACAAKPHPPTEKEIAEFRRTHPVPARDNALTVDDGVDRSDVQTGYWVGESDIVLHVEIIGDFEVERIPVYGGYIRTPFTPARVVEIVSYKQENKFGFDFKVGDTISICSAIMKTGESYLIIGFERQKRNELSVIEPQQEYYITDSSYLIAVENQRNHKDYTSTSLDAFKSSLKALTVENGWSSEFSETEKVKVEPTEP